MMLRALGLFLLVFSLLSLVVHLDGLGQLFGTAALCLFAIELVTRALGQGHSCKPNAGRAPALGEEALQRTLDRLGMASAGKSAIDGVEASRAIRH